MERDKLCKELQIKIGKILINKKLTLRDVCGILDMAKHFFLMKGWEKI